MQLKKNIKSVILVSFLSMIFPTISFAVDVGAIKVSGVLKIDERLFSGNTKPTSLGIQATNQRGVPGTYNSGAFIRDAGLTFEGEITQDVSYTFALDFQTDSNSVRVDDAYLTYYGFKNYLPNLSFSVGQVIPGFCLTCAASSKWIPFLERSMGTNTFGPQQGLGINANTYNNNYSATVAITQQPKAGSQLKTVTGSSIRTKDVWQTSGRFTYAPIAEDGKVIQFGLSAHILEYANYGLQFSPMPEMRSGGNSTSLLNTTNPVTGILIAAKNQKTADLDFLFIRGPWSGELEYQEVYITRGTYNNVKQGSNLKFKGYHAQVSYILTGESRPLKRSNGTLGQIKPQSKKGAWEVSARYSYIGLNNKDITGGMAHNTSASLAWYANNNIKVIGEYVVSKQRRQFPTYTDRRHVNGLGARLQLVF